jgi:hypothetical protein
MYAMLERESKEAGLSLNWPRHLPNTREALAAVEWVRQHRPRAFPQLHRDLFAAHFVLGEDLEDASVIDRQARDSDVDLADLHAAIADGSAVAAVTDAEVVRPQVRRSRHTGLVAGRTIDCWTPPGSGIRTPCRVRRAIAAMKCRSLPLRDS